MKQKQFPQAIKYYESVLAMNPENTALQAATFRTIAQCYFEMGSYEQAIVAADRSLAKFAQNPGSLDRDALFELLVMQAGAYQRVKDLASAKQIFEKLLVQFPNRLETHVGLGTLYKRMNLDAQAEKEFTYVISIDTMNVIALNNLANILRDRGEFVKADSYYRQSLKIAPGNAVILKNVERLKQMSRGRYGN
jgi:tetratricopeptide (TPR) repeat protein